MQWLAAVCVRRPVFTWVLMLVLIVFGIASYRGLGVDRFPNIDLPIVVVSTVLRGASPEQVETEVTDKVEESLNSISGLEELRSTSFEGLSVVTAQFALEKDIAEAAQEVRDHLNRALPQLPHEIDQPQVQRIDPGAVPVMLVALSGPRSVRELTEFATRRVRRQLESLNGVGGVTVLGGRARQIRVTVDPARLQSLGLSVSDVQRAFSTQNVEVPGGQVQAGARSLQLRVQGRVSSLDEIADLVVAQRGATSVRVRDVGAVFDDAEEPTSAATLSGKSVVVLSVVKQSGVNAIAVVDALRGRLDELRRSLPPGYELKVVRDESVFVRNAVKTVEEHLVIGAALAGLVVLLFLRSGRSTIIAGLAIPTSIIATFAMIRVLGLTLNVITLLALTLSVGIVIDDAIVVLENIVRFIEERGLRPARAAILATREIGLAVLATTLSLVAVFLPVSFMSGIVGRFLGSFGLTMSFAILVSLLVSFTLTPMLSGRWLARGKGGSHAEGVGAADAHGEASTDSGDAPSSHEEPADPAPGPRAEERRHYAEWRAGQRVLPPAFAAASEHSGGLYGRLESAYLSVLAAAMRHRWVVGLAIIGVLLSVGPIGKRVAMNFIPIDDESRFELTVTAAEGTALDQTRILSERIAQEVRGITGVEYTVTTVGSPPGDASGRGANQASIYIGLVEPSRRAMTQAQIISQVRRDILPTYEKRDGLRLFTAAVSAFGGGGSANAPIQYVLRGPDLGRLSDYSSRLLAELRQIPGVVDAGTTLVTGRPEYVVQIDRARAADLGVNVLDVANSLRMLVGGVQVSTFNDGSEQYDVALRATEAARIDPQSIAQITVPAQGGKTTVRLADIVHIGEKTGPAAIYRLSRQRQVTLYCNVLPGASEAAITAQLDAARDRLGLAAGYSAAITGRAKELKRTASAFLTAIALSFIFMYLVLAAQFESWLHPLTVLVSLPLTVPFALVSLLVLGQSLNMFSALGILVLFGVVKKNSILQVDHMRDLRRRGLGRADAVMLANRDRLRPILMTTVAFVAGMIPMVVSSGAGAATNRAMGSVIIGGQSLALFLTLIATPVVYSWLDDLAHAHILSGLWSQLRGPRLRRRTAAVASDSSSPAAPSPVAPSPAALV
ncbi:MAG TPA: efflux RND transporter permease subunit [Pseudomonadota bacterium]|nr:efflux RND transporter permease subunit [Pseudomonadota bacterium]